MDSAPGSARAQRGCGCPPGALQLQLSRGDQSRALQERCSSTNRGQAVWSGVHAGPSLRGRSCPDQGALTVLGRGSSGFQRAPQRPRVGRRQLRRVWWRSAGLQNGASSQDGCSAVMGWLGTPCCVRPAEEFFKNNEWYLWLSLSLGKHSHLHKDREILQKYIMLRKKI